MILYRGSGADARRYLESDRSRAADYYLDGGTALAEFFVVDGNGDLIGEGALTPDQYAQWVDWTNPLTGESMGTPRHAGNARHTTNLTLASSGGNPSRGLRRHLSTSAREHGQPSWVLRQIDRRPKVADY
nr:relaxase domain-containing protein [Agromyces protaetiae]